MIAHLSAVLCGGGMMLMPVNDPLVCSLMKSLPAFFYDFNRRFLKIHRSEELSIFTTGRASEQLPVDDAMD